jgi:organic hydroperoxide reductase OsmC/OhrA
VLRPKIAFNGNAPGADELTKLHEAAHRNCFIGNSITAAVRVE